ncbi:MAG: hypothetical protein HY537_02125 [Deltaproteobacteria bacterium]|nr:hypothetical protein [Deltaproteobacteria bacterium]
MGPKQKVTYKRAGFTLMSLLMAVVVVGLLGLVLPITTYFFAAMNTLSVRINSDTDISLLSSFLAKDYSRPSCDPPDPLPTTSGPHPYETTSTGSLLQICTSYTDDSNYNQIKYETKCNDISSHGVVVTENARTALASAASDMESLCPTVACSSTNRYPYVVRSVVSVSAGTATTQRQSFFPELNSNDNKTLVAIAACFQNGKAYTHARLVYAYLKSNQIKSDPLIGLVVKEQNLVGTDSLILDDIFNPLY